MINGYEDGDELTSLFYFRCDLEYDLVMTLTVTLTLVVTLIVILLSHQFQSSPLL